jgi:cytochrome P450
MAERAPVTDWATDFDHTDPTWVSDPFPIWEDLRQRCPVAHSERYGGVWLPTKHDDISAIAYDTEHFTSQGVIVSPTKPEIEPPIGPAPPITSDPPFHAFARRLLLPAFSPKATAQWETATRELCVELIDAVVSKPDPDAALDYAQHIPVGVIARMLGLPLEDSDKFRNFIHRIIEDINAHGEDIAIEDTFDYYLDGVIDDHRRNPRGDLVDYLLGIEIDGQPLSQEHVRGTIALLLIAGIDTTWSAIGASLWHLAQHPEHRRRLATEPDLLPFAVEEFLRAYAPVTMARIVAKDVTIDGAEMKPGDWVLLPFPAANRDPEQFERADEVVIDRTVNRHAAFGLGIHRCLGSNLARMEMTIALEEWVKRVPDFELADPDAVTWSAGQVRGPRSIPIRILDRG